MLDKEKAVQGVGVYAEYARPSTTVQLLVCPDGYTSDGQLVGLTVVRRVVKIDNPKTPWKLSIDTPIDPEVTIEDEDKDDYCARRFSVPGGPALLLDQLISGQWPLVGAPILIEFSQKDFDDIAAKKTPSRAIYRVNQSRTALGYPEAIVSA